MCGKVTVAFVIAVATNAVVAMDVDESPVVGVGAVGVPVKCGLAFGARPVTAVAIAEFLLVTS